GGAQAPARSSGRSAPRGGGRVLPQMVRSHLPHEGDLRRAPGRRGAASARGVARTAPGRGASAPRVSARTAAQVHVAPRGAGGVHGTRGDTALMTWARGQMAATWRPGRASWRTG